MSTPMWRIAAGRGGYFVKDFVGGGFVAIGFREAGDCTAMQSRDAMIEHFRVTYAAKSEQQIVVLASQVWRFLRVCAVGDDVVTYDPAERVYNVGRILSPPRFDTAGDEELLSRRSVEWRATAARDSLSEGSKARLIVGMTVSLVAPAVANELRALIGEAVAGASTARGQEDPAEALMPTATPLVGEDRADPLAGIESLALERLKDRIGALDGYELQDLAAALLRAMGYRTTVSPRGADRGRDIVASPDGYGLVPPRIVVEVKHRAGHIGAPEIRSFLGGRHREDRGLYISTGGFTNEARYEAERASIPVKLMTLDDLARAIVEHYDRFDEAGRTLLPLTRILWAI